MATLNESFPQGTDSGSSPRCQDTILGGGVQKLKLAKTVNEERQIQALVDKKKVIITETSIRSDLKLDDAEGTDCLPTANIFVELEIIGPGKGFSGKATPLFKTMMVQATEDMGEDSAALTDSHSTPIHTQPSLFKPQKKKSRRKQRKDSSPTKPIPDEAINEEHVATPSYDSPQSDLEIESLKRRVKSLEKRRKSRTPRFKRLRKVGLASRVESSNDVSLGAQEDASKQGRKIANLDADAEEKEVVEKEVSVADPITTAGEIVTTANVEVTTANALTTTIDELTLDQTLIEIKAAKPKAITSATTTTTTTRPKARGVAKDKGKAKIVEPEKPWKKKDQIAMDKEVARNLEAQLQAKLEEEERISRLKE
ncbi:hypothetical protein Tco_0296001 [Tanacetum coccineum]